MPDEVWRQIRRSFQRGTAIGSCCAAMTVPAAFAEDSSAVRAYDIDFDTAAGFMEAQDQAGAALAAGAFSLTVGVDWASSYYFRGIIQEDDGFIIQPYVEVGYQLIETDNGSIDFFVGIWNSIHSDEDTAATEAFEEWYELDVYTGMNFSYDDWSFGFIYTNLASPSDAFDSVHEVGFSIGYSDSGLFGSEGGAFGNENGWFFGSGLNPGITVISEFGDVGSGGGPGVYLELGVEPGWEVALTQDLPLSISVPVTVGLGFDDYYAVDSDADDTFGFVQFGVAGSIPLPINWGEWSLSASINGLILGDANEERNGGDDAEVVGFVGLSVSF